jgi:hypothetical protein
MFSKTNIRVLTLAALAATTTVAHSYESYYSVPGTRANGMAGAFVAQADDSTAMHYNPAGLAHAGPVHDITVEMGNKLTYSTTQGRHAGTQDLKWLSYKSGNLGVAYYKPYEFNFGSSTLEYAITSFGAGRDLGDGLKAGITLDLISASGAKTDSGYGMSVGFIKELAKNQTIFSDIKFDLSLGLLARNEAEMGKGNDSTSVVSRPAEKTWGLNAKFQNLIPNALVSVNYANSLKEWDRAAHYNCSVTGTSADTCLTGLDYVREAFGAEISMAASDSMQLFFRLGRSYAKAANASYIDASSNTYGFGVAFSNFAVDISSEKRDLNYGRESHNLTSVSASLFF